MKRQAFTANRGKALLIMIVMIGLALPMGLAQDADAASDLMVKISRLEKTLDIIDSIGMDAAGQVSTGMIRDMLQGTDWVDPERSIIISLDNAGGRKFSAVLIPYSRKNPNFKQGFNAMDHDDYYIFSLPPGNTVYVPEAIEKEMARASKKGSSSVISISLAVSELVISNRDTISDLPDVMAQAQRQAKPGQVELTPQDLADVLEGFVKSAEQVKTLTFNIDLTELQFKGAVEVEAEKGSDLSKLFVSSGMTTRLGGYVPAEDITYRSRSYDVDNALDLVNEVFGNIYRKMGVDYEAMMAIGNSFTGESAGGLSYDTDNRIRFETMAVLKDEVDSKTFLDNVFLPWAMTYSQDLQKMMAEEFGTDVGPIFTRTQDSTVAGHRVVGLSARLLLSPMPSDEVKANIFESMMQYDNRIAVVGSLVLMAPDDTRMAQMIATAKSLRKKTSRGPLMTVEIDVARYLASLARFIPGHNIDPKSIPDLGLMSIVTEVSKGRINTSTSMYLEDMQLMMSYIKWMEPGAARVTGTPPSAPKKKKKVRVEKKPPPPVVKDAAYWVDQGGLAATYGAYDTSIKYYKKALAMGSEKSRVYFNMGVAYGELGDYPQAMANLEKAIELKPENGNYYYARGRVYLLSGANDNAMLDFEHAAEAGSVDAQQYLEGEGQ